MRTVAFALFGGLLLACAASEPPPPRVPLPKRAEIDLRCPSGELQYRPSDERVWEVRGCNKRAFYVKRCGDCLDPVTFVAQVPVTSRCDCAWVLTHAPPADPQSPAAANR